MTRRSRRAGDVEGRLRDLWKRRPTLSEPEWAELYGIVANVLANKCPDLIAQLPGAGEEYVQDYFLDKVLSLGNPGDEIHHAGALVVFYKRYLLSRLRDPYLRRVLGPRSGDAGDDSEATPLEKALDVQAREADAGEHPATVRHLTDWVASELGPLSGDAAPGSDPSDVHALFMRHLGVDLEEVEAAARAFLQGRDDWSHLAGDAWWIRLYLRCHFCPEKPDAMALSTLERRHRIPSYHYKAVSLGVSVPKHRDAALAAFRESYRGQWLARLGIPVDPDHLLEMSLALKVLCLVALQSEEPC